MDVPYSSLESQAVLKWSGGSPQRTVAVYNCPKPPSTRISLTLSAITRSREVWLMTTGDAKASAVATLMEEGVTPQLLPAAGALGSHATRVFLDAAAASLLSNCADLRASAR